MILSKDQINRYLRHIIIPEISGPGQKKIIETKIYLSSTTVQEASPLIYYLAASGFGFISCNFKDNDGYENLFSNVNDLNGDVLVELTDNQLPIVCSSSVYNDGSVIRILISKYTHLEENLISFSREQISPDFIPTVVIINSGFKGFLQCFCKQEELNSFLSSPLPLDLDSTMDIDVVNEGQILSNCLLSALTTIECIKLSLKIGTILDKPLYFNLLSMDFHKADNKDFKLAIAAFLKNSNSNNQLTSKLKKPYNKKLSDCKVLIVGTGGLGSPVAYALSCLGIGTIGVVDYDKVELSNLNRQILHATSRTYMPKVKSAEIFLKNLNPKVKVVTHNTILNIYNAIDIIKDYDVIIDALDNFPARYLLNDSCFFENKPLVDAAAVRFHGVIMTILPNSGPCYRCAFPIVPNQKSGMTCSEAGVLGAVPGVMGFIQAAEVVKLLLGIGDTLSNRIIYYDALDSDFDIININRSSKCDLCGAEPTITSLIEYTTSCESNNNNNNNKGIS